MRASGETLKGCAGTVGLRRLAARVRGENRNPSPTTDMVALLLPMVIRAVTTERGPFALVHWLHQRTGGTRTGPPTEQAARRLTEDLVRAMRDLSPDLLNN